MALVPVSSIAFASVETPFGKRERMLGGSATHFSLAASFFADVRVVGVLGEDFGEEELSVLVRAESRPTISRGSRAGARSSGAGATTTT